MTSSESGGDNSTDISRGSFSNLAILLWKAQRTHVEKQY